jgi:hypothetical protein
MEQMQKKSEEAAAPPTTPLPPAAPPVQPAPPPPVVVVQPTPAPAPEATPPFYRRAWFWGLVGGVVVAGTVTGLWAGGVFSSKSNDCKAGFSCLPSTSP